MVELGTRIMTWFERDRAHVALVDSLTEQITIVEWWDDEVAEAVTDGYLDPKDWYGSALEYARGMGLLDS